MWRMSLLDYIGRIGFLKTKPPDSDGCYAPKHASSIFEGSVKPLELDTACHTELHLDGILAKTNFTTLGIAPSSLPERQNKNEQQCQLATDNGGVNSRSGICFPFRYNNCMIDMDTEKDHTLVKERLDSCNLRCGNLPESSLWTNKYQPENTSELCGNIKSIRILNEWLKSWDEGPRSNRSFYSTIKGFHDDSSDSESYMDDVDDQAIHKNALLLTGTIGFV